MDALAGPQLTRVRRWPSQTRVVHAWCRSLSSSRRVSALRCPRSAVAQLENSDKLRQALRAIGQRVRICRQSRHRLALLFISDSDLMDGARERTRALRQCGELLRHLRDELIGFTNEFVDTSTQVFTFDRSFFDL